ncbi:DMT family transporter [Maritalea porphyrae]|uniref:DMT family transporter n=1 Tax=Maritalea porphyrae TaxID=880732 RepID=UPI0022B076AC|nr:DMT family transporter [Maritalea porphyrae]MCZ4271094.1 DMT family transporter [Maritalea porphyrae]
MPTGQRTPTTQVRSQNLPNKAQSTSSPHGQVIDGREKLRGHFAMILFAMLISASFSFGALAAPHIDAGALSASRFLLASIVMGLIAYFTGNKLVEKGKILPKAPLRFILLGALMGVYFVTMFEALKITSPVSTGAVFTLMPLISAGFGILFLAQRVSSRMTISLLIAAAGAVWVIFRGDLNALLSFNIGTGEMIFFVGVICHGAYAPLVRKLNRGEPVVIFSFWTLLACAVCLCIYAAWGIARTDWLNLPAVVYWAGLYLTIFTTALTFFLLQYASMRLPASKVMSYGYLTPSFIILIEGVSGRGWVNPSVALGALVTVMALLVLAFAKET